MQNAVSSIFCRHHVVFFISVQAVATDWTPPDNPDLLQILHEARLDMQAKRYESELEKHFWFHENAEQIDESISAVRTSFALYDWVRLGQEYPPAMDELLQVRGGLITKLINEEYDRNAFRDLVSINAVLNEDSKTTEIFKLLDSEQPEAANRAFNFAQPALIKDKEYELYVKYVNPQHDFLRMKHSFESGMLSANNSDSNTSRSDFYINSFRNKAATLVAVLVVNDRELEAAEISTLAKEVLDDPQFHEELEDTLAGTVPVPWP
ncbi:MULTISPECIES: hypothetical protein [Halomonadaceae]|nr:MULTISPECIES: hypothetical protein [Halomonas]|tara:strand:+ start:2299 stop:3093 length:795 start_codon:yes stop_codon:yes gene_type:complete